MLLYNIQYSLFYVLYRLKQAVEMMIVQQVELRRQMLAFMGKNQPIQAFKDPIILFLVDYSDADRASDEAFRCFICNESCFFLYAQCQCGICCIGCLPNSCECERRQYYERCNPSELNILSISIGFHYVSLSTNLFSNASELAHAVLSTTHVSKRPSPLKLAMAFEIQQLLLQLKPISCESHSKKIHLQLVNFQQLFQKIEVWCSVFGRKALVALQDSCCVEERREKGWLFCQLEKDIIQCIKEQVDKDNTHTRLLTSVKNYYLLLNA